jgi:branched-chain amino acid transport system permease protein
MGLDAFAGILISGLVLGALYATMATGLSLVWSTLGIFNFTHGVFMTLGAYVAWQVGTAEGWGMGAAAGLAVAIAVLVGLGCLVEVLLVRPFVGRPDTVMLAVITTLAAMTILQNGVLLAWGPRLKQLPPLIAGNVTLFGVTISAHEVLVLGLAPAVLAALWLFLARTRTGAAIRAVGQNPEAAVLMGLNVRALYLLAFALSAGLAALAGILLGSIRFISPEMGSEPLVKALIVAIFGGLGTLGGTVGGAFVIGLLEAFSMFFVGLYLTPALLFAVMILVLMLRPEGLFGRRG